MRTLLIFCSLIISYFSLEAKTALVTGGAGFLGSHLCDRLIGEGNKVICIDNLSTGSLRNIAHLLDHPQFQFIDHDVTEPLALEIAVDEIYSLACPASPVHYQKDPIKTMKTSVLGAFFSLELAKKCGAKVFQSSTSEIYGDPLVHPQIEEYWGNVNPIGIRSCYDEGKRCAESLFFDYWRVHGVRIKVARIFNTYGPRMDSADGRVVSNFIVQALSGAPITIFGDGSQTRSFCYVDDLIDAILAFMQTPDDVTGPINIGNAGEFTMLELADSVLKLTGSSSQIVFHELPQDDPKVRQPNLSLARKVLQWEPKISLEEGLQPTIDYFRKELQKI